MVRRFDDGGYTDLYDVIFSFLNHLSEYILRGGSQEETHKTVWATYSGSYEISFSVKKHYVDDRTHNSILQVPKRTHSNLQVSARATLNPQNTGILRKEIFKDAIKSRRNFSF